MLNERSAIQRERLFIPTDDGGGTIIDSRLNAVLKVLANTLLLDIGQPIITEFKDLGAQGLTSPTPYALGMFYDWVSHRITPLT